MTLKAKFDELLEKQRALKAEFQVTAQALFKETFKEFFALNPAIQAVVWTQYTPYFNDGDTCTFGVNDLYFTNATGDAMDEVCRYGEYEGDDETIWSETSYAFVTDSKYYKEFQHKLDYKTVNPDSIRALDKLIHTGEMEEVMEAMFGDHVRIVATRNGFDVEDHDHD